MSYWEAAPGPAVAPFVERVCFSRDDGPPPYAAVRVVPDGAVDVLFSTRSDGATSARVFGLKTRALLVETREPCENVALRLRPGAAERLFRAPAHQLADTAPELRALVGPRADEWCARAGAARSADARRAELERALGAWSTLAARAPDGDDVILQRMVSEIRARSGALRIGPLADRLGVGARRLERLFRARIGVGPKAYARIVRFRAAWRALAAGSDPLSAALAHGYFDQAHLCRDFRALAGAPPRRIFPSGGGGEGDSLPA